ncbi:MAG: D-alanyl-D-alanine carboxypeptidase/D-alanyl-D-alanine-endopeptidase [Planctomycetes bacterium]|nr:D-alanyl-D-alanine carboxypeptidase/D-alanyl-D-alanine-endopeptidase [Planctomycetota bacterium]
MNTGIRRWRGLTLVLAAIVAAGCAEPRARLTRQLTARLDEILERLADTGATVTARVVELPGRRELYARDSDVPYTPASNMKIPVSAAGLDMFGLEHTFKTYLVLDGDDLWVLGTGDPGIGDPRLARRYGSSTTGVLDEWADALARRGISRIAGDLCYDDRALDDEWVRATWGEDTLHWYGAPTAGLNFNDNCVDITIYPTVAGQPVRYEVVPPVQNITVVNECVTGAEHAPTIEKLPAGDIYKLGGTCAEQAALKSKPVGNPGAFFCDALRTHLAARGIVIEGQTRRATEPLDRLLSSTPHEIIVVHVTNMPDVLRRINTNSQNFFAEALCKLTGQAYRARQGHHVRGSWADGSAAIHAFLREAGIDDRQFVLADGSGLSDDNKVTTRMLTDLFAVMFARPYGEAYRDSLAKGGVNGTLEQRFAGLEGRVFAKTGYISGVRALSGYVRTYEDGWLTFSIIYNHIPGSVQPYESLQDEAVRLLVHWPYMECAALAQPAEPVAVE